jgi:hypothetical protein
MTCKCPWALPARLEPETKIRKARSVDCGENHDKRELPYSEWQQTAPGVRVR